MTKILSNNVITLFSDLTDSKYSKISEIYNQYHDGESKIKFVKFLNLSEANHIDLPLGFFSAAKLIDSIDSHEHIMKTNNYHNIIKTLFLQNIKYIDYLNFISIF